MPVEFPFGTKVTSLGRVADPVIPILVLTLNGYVSFDFLVDTGADCSMMPASIAESELGVNLAQCSKDIFFGIEGHGIHVYRGWLSLKIGPHPLRVRCVFSSHEHTPLILGRMDLFRHFSLTFDNRRRVIRFTKVSSQSRFRHSVLIVSYSLRGNRFADIANVLAQYAIRHPDGLPPYAVVFLRLKGQQLYNSKKLGKDI